MPKVSMDNCTSEGVMNGMNEILESSYQAALKEYNGDESRASAVAWAAAKNKYEKNSEGKWTAKSQKMSETEPQETDWIEILKEGAFRLTAEHIKPAKYVTVKAEHLEKILETYNEHKDDPDYAIPAIPGHTKDEFDQKPAVSFLTALKKEGKSLWAKFKNEAGEFTRFMKAMPKRSIEGILSGNMSMLRAVAFGSSMIPVIKGMSYNFSHNDETVIINLNEEEINMDEILKLQEAHKVELAKLTEAHDAEVKRLNEAITTKDAAYAELKQTADAAVLKLSEIEKAKRHSDIESRIKALSTKEKPKIAPAELTELITLAESLTDDQVNGFIKSIENRPDIITFGEASEKGKDDEIKVSDDIKYSRQDPRVIRLAADKKVDLTKLSVDEFNDFVRPIVQNDMDKDKGKPVENEQE